MKFFISKKHNMVVVQDNGLCYPFTLNMMVSFNRSLTVFMHKHLVRGHMRDYTPKNMPFSMDDSFEEVNYENF